jgi:indole-3-glycerol phosphate synthase/phosphoribosylanthranilate isomerase
MLEAIVKSKRAEVEQAKRERPVAELLEGLHPSDRDFQAAIGRRRTGFILECKRQSPSQGPIRENANPVDVASAYAPFADAISVLTDGPFFGGSLEDLTRVRESGAGGPGVAGLCRGGQGMRHGHVDRGAYRRRT